MAQHYSAMRLQPTLMALAAAAACLSVQAQDTTTLSEVVVSASGFEQELKQAPASITVVTREELERKSVRDLAEALHGVEGIDVRGGQGKTGGFNISMRGMPSGYTLLLVDGQRTNPAGDTTPNGFGDAFNAMIPPMSAIERIEVIRGPMSTLYGSDAMGGVINIITRKVAKKWNGSVAVEGSLPQTQGEGATQKTNFYLSGPIAQDKLGIAIRGGYMNRDGYDGDLTGAPSNGGHSPAKADTYNLGAKLTLTPSQGQQIWLDVEAQRATYDNRTNQLGTLDQPGNAGGYGPEMRMNRDIVSLGYENNTTLGLLSTVLSHRDTETQGRTIPSEATKPGRVLAGRTELDGTPRLLESTTTSLDSKLISPIGEHHVLTSGFQFNQEEAKDGVAIYTGTPKFSQRTWALFAEDEWAMHPEVTLTTGLRYDHHDKFGGHLNPRAYVVWNATEILTFKGGISKGFRAPRLNQLTSGANGYTSQGKILTVGNPNLQPESSTSTELGMLFDNQQGWSGGVTLFHNDIKNIITSDGQCTGISAPIAGCEPNAQYSVNADSGKTYGAEFSNKLALKNGIDLKISYTWTESQIEKNGLKEGRISDTAKHLLLANASWKINQQWSSWLQAEYRAGARRTGDVATENEMFKAYSLFHVGVNYAVTPQVNVGLSINNLFNRDFRSKNSKGDYNYYVGGGRNAKGVTQDGRTIWLRTSVQF
ncbi:MAG: TonB-dependent receptor domain-containing protein [Comamonas sp.]